VLVSLSGDVHRLESSWQPMWGPAD
jgi:hypothetical protein